MKILYSFNKKGFEADYWTQEILTASFDSCEFVPFNHGVFLDPNLYLRAQLLDNLYFEKDPRLMKLYESLLRLIKETNADVLIVDNCFPYHPEFLRALNVYKVLRTTDGPMTAYDRDFAYLHAYDHVLYHSPAYSPEIGMEEKLRYCGARKVDFWPLGSFDALCDSYKSEDSLMNQPRDIDVIFVGALHLNKMPMLAKVKKALGKRMKLYGLANIKKNLYFNFKYNFPGWVRPIDFHSYVNLYQRAKIGVNIHNRGDYTVGGYRLFDLPANGVMQISDGGVFLNSFFETEKEIVPHFNSDDLIDKIKYYLSHDDERKYIALNGLKRVRSDYQIKNLLAKSSELIKLGMETHLC